MLEIVRRVADGAGYRCLAPDLYGYGRSAYWPGGAPLRLSDEAATVDRLIADSDRPVFSAACFAEKDATFTNSERRIQRVHKAVEPPGDAESDAFMVDQWVKHLKQLYAQGGTFQGDGTSCATTSAMSIITAAAPRR